MPAASEVEQHRRKLSQPAMPEMLASAAAPASDTMFIKTEQEDEVEQRLQTSADSSDKFKNGPTQADDDQSTEDQQIGKRAFDPMDDGIPSIGADLDVVRPVSPAEHIAPVETTTTEAQPRKEKEASTQKRRAHLHGHATARSTSADDDLNRLVLEKYTFYETKTKLYIIASNQSDSRYRVLKIDRTAPSSRTASAQGNEKDHNDFEDRHDGLVITEDAAIYDKHEIQALMATLDAGNGGIPRSDVYYGILGFVRFTSTYYMILVKHRLPVALIGGHYIYHCEETVLRPITPPTGSRTAEEARQMAAFQGVDLSKNFYFSYTYDLTHTLQHNLTRITGDPQDPPNAAHNDKWVWNRHLLHPALQGGGKSNSRWLLPLIHGFVDQAKLSVFGKTVYITVIARRSRHFAGARFLKRGVNDEGYVANDVETEQIVSEVLTTPFHCPAPSTHRHPQTGLQHQNRRPSPRYTSFVQVRGSIPLYWSQESVNMSPKPPIELTIIDPYYAAAALHFDDLLGRYGAPITVLNLIKQKERAPRESKLLPEFKQCIDYLNQFLPADKEIAYIPWDIAAANKQRDKDVIGILEDIAEESMEKTSFFHSGAEPTLYSLHHDEDCPPYRSTPLLQTGVVRTNCIDCLDRTNAAQFVIAKAALGHQLHALGVIYDPRLPFDSDAVNLITEMYHDHGDTIALQYGGSHLVNTMETYRKIGQWSSHSRDMIENLRRYYANSFVDADKQAAIDLFLGIEQSTAPLPSHPYRSTRDRRSYRDWYTPGHLEQTLTPAQAEERLRLTVAHEDDGTTNYWQVYYRPNLLTDLSKHFAFKVNSTLKYRPSNLSGELAEQSPFIPRVTAHQHQHQVTPRLPVGGVRRWMSHRANNSADKRGENLEQQSARKGGTAAGVITTGAGGASGVATSATAATTEALVGRLLNPSTSVEEAAEYAHYVDQFSSLSLSQDLSEKDAVLYRTTTALMLAEPDESSRNMYSEMVQRSSRV